MEFCSLFSGSSGNSLFIKHNNTKLLCDAGKNGKRVEEALNAIGERAEELDGIIITHEHTDHISAAGVLSRRYDLPIYANLNTWEAMHNQKIGKIAPKNERVFEVHKPFTFDELKVNSFHTSHDAADPVGFVIEDGVNKLGIATDTGIITPDMQAYLPGCELVVLESNHDTKMLEVCPYPYYLKRRISGSMGHLSNVNAAEFALELVKRGTNRLILAHLSKENNMPILAEQETATLLGMNQIIPGRDVDLEIALRDTIGRKYRF